MKHSAALPPDESWILLSNLINGKIADLDQSDERCWLEDVAPVQAAYVLLPAGAACAILPGIDQLWLTVFHVLVILLMKTELPLGPRNAEMPDGAPFSCFFVSIQCTMALRAWERPGARRLKNP